MDDVSFRAMGTDIRLIGDDVEAARAWLERYEARLSRFRPESELSRLNADPHAEIEASPMLRAAIQAALWAAERSGGLADPTVDLPTDPLGTPAAVTDALACAPRRRRATPSHRWRRVGVRGTAIARPAGVRLDTGGSGKGLAADQLARIIGGTADCGGDIRVTGTQEVLVEHPITGEACATLRITDGAVATSGIDRRLWRRPDGTFGHHLLDPATGEPAWTGIITATALAPTALEAEALAKAALLGDRRALETHGGVLVREDGDVELVAGR